MPSPKQREFDLKHLKNLSQYSKEVQKAYNAVIAQVSQMAVPLSLNKNDEFYFRNYPEISKKVDGLLDKMYENVYGTTVSGMNQEWALGEEKQNQIAEYIYGKGLKDLPPEWRQKYLTNNAEAMENFIKRKDSATGLGLSDKVWRNTKQFKQELELALEVGIGSGKSAQSMARDIKQYLNDPDKLFRRVRDKGTGQLRLSKAAEAYHPGQGRYRSSYKNALRLTRNETNFSYEGAQHAKRQQQDFVVGIEIRVSPQHNPADDKGGISCVDLQGKYPKDFDFTFKWHVNCKCMTLNVLKTVDELNKDLDKILEGGEPDGVSVNAVKGLPGNYTNYLKDNKKTWENWKNQPRTFEGNQLEKFAEKKVETTPVLSKSGAYYKDLLQKAYDKGSLFGGKQPDLELPVEFLNSIPEGVKLTTIKGKSAYFMPNTNTVNIDVRLFRGLDDTDVLNFKRVAYHEFGHAFNQKHKILSVKGEFVKIEGDPDFDKFFEKWKKHYSDPVKAKELLHSLYSSGGGAGVGEAADCLCAFTEGKLGYGHSKAYFQRLGTAPNEIIAHCFENRFGGNKFMKKYMPEFYEESIELTNLLLKKYGKK